MESTEFLKILTAVYEDNDLDEIINTDPKVYKRFVIIPFSTIFYLQEGLDRRETEIILMNGEAIIALEKIAVIEEKWHKWYERNSSLFTHTKSN